MNSPTIMDLFPRRVLFILSWVCEAIGTVTNAERCSEEVLIKQVIKPRHVATQVNRQANSKNKVRNKTDQITDRWQQREPK